MRFETNLRRALGLGSAKSGVHPWIMQRFTAIALIPLSLWFVGIFILHLNAPFDISYRQFSSLWTITISVFFVMVMFYHGYLGIKVILEDYIPHKLTKWLLIILTKFFSLFMVLLAIFSLLRVFLK
jgi:succinate dehydrogenase / fumarate reductase membrane anchor subunit